MEISEDGSGLEIEFNDEETLKVRECGKEIISIIHKHNLNYGESMFMLDKLSKALLMMFRDKLLSKET